MNQLKKQMCAALKTILAGGRAEVPSAGQQIMDAFLALSRARSIGPLGPNPISWEAVAAWVALMRVPLEPRHVDIIMALDDVWMSHAFSRAERADGVKPLPPISQQPLTAALLDAVMG